MIVTAHALSAGVVARCPIRRPRIERHDVEPHNVEPHNVEPHNVEPHNVEPHNVERHASGGVGDTVSPVTGRPRHLRSETRDGSIDPGR
ncbi:Conserved hypothetical protein [Micromonospora lupini str. Lupac 08]|uniref:Uncharacterized protein n=1 Tax=Micromonospora lupini str. Lupac 08 TaxID=1150864 RepID=I0L9B0_9ACTN|nr:Conserved hypothetical protein [Micromonospora lupini str. Lupac 08]